MKRLLVLFFIALSIFEIHAQVNKYGVPIVRNYLTEVTQGAEQNWCITKDIFGNVYFGSQDRGVLRYDGTKWSSIQIKDNPRISSLASDNQGIVFVGAAYEFGYLQPGENGNQEYVSLAERIDSVPEINVIWSVAVVESKVYFQSNRNIYIYDIAADSLSRMSLKRFGLANVLRLSKVNGKLIINDNVKGLFELNDTGITRLPGGEYFMMKPCTVLVPFDESRILVCTYQHGIFLYDYITGKVDEEFIDRSLNKKLMKRGVFSATQVSNDLFCIGATNQEGAIVINRSGELVQQLKKDFCDMADDAIYAMYCDHRAGSELWLSVLGAISKVYINIPVTHFGEKQGIDVGVNELCEFNNNIYVSTDAGILKSYTDEQNTLKFKEITGTSNQFFPLEVFTSSYGDFLLAGSIVNGLFQITENDGIRSVEKELITIQKSGGVLSTVGILQSKINPEILFVGLFTGGVQILKYSRDHWTDIDRISSIYGNITGMEEDTDGMLWISTDDPTSLIKVTFGDKDTLSTIYGTSKGLPESNNYKIRILNTDLYVNTSTGMFRYEKSEDKFISDNTPTDGYSEGKYVRNVFIDAEGDTWLSGEDIKNYEMLFRKKGERIERYKSTLAILPNVTSIDLLSKEGRVFMTKSKLIHVVDKSRLKPDSLRAATLFTSILVGSDSVVMKGSFFSESGKLKRIPVPEDPSPSTPEYSYELNNIHFEWTTPYYIDEQLITYSYKLDGFEDDWSDWGMVFYKEYTSLSYGHYTFRVKAKTVFESETKEALFSFIILKPWYLRIWMILFYIVATLLLVWAIIAYYTRRLKNENIRLEGIVAERTAVVVKQKEELESSIHYASRIQMALLPSETIIHQNLKNYFVLFKPRDIVSGDFYWMTKKGERLYIVAADCTGHGVPGAFMSLLGMSFLDEIIDKEKAPRADYILNQLRLHVTESLKQSGGDDEAKDGMDIAILVIDFNTQRIEFSGAYNPCFRLRKLTDEEAGKYKNVPGELPDGSMTNGKYLLETIYASKMPIGISSRMNEDFVFYDWNLERGISYYLFSDGYIDQFGGAHGRKFMKKNFKRLLLDIQDYPMNKQKELLDNNLKEWMGQSPQIDDILVMGIRTD